MLASETVVMWLDVKVEVCEGCARKKEAVLGCNFSTL